MEVYGLEEKKAIESLIEIREFANLSSYKDTKISQLNAIDVVLNLIEKQSKEIEELKDKNKFYNTAYNLGKIYSNKKWEDKIKAKIEELIKEGNYRTTDNPNGRVHFQKEITDYQIEVLQSLLEKE